MKDCGESLTKPAHKALDGYVYHNARDGEAVTYTLDEWETLISEGNKIYRRVVDAQNHIANDSGVLSHRESCPRIEEGGYPDGGVDGWIMLNASPIFSKK